MTINPRTLHTTMVSGKAPSAWLPVLHADRIQQSLSGMQISKCDESQSQQGSAFRRKAPGRQFHMHCPRMQDRDGDKGAIDFLQNIVSA